MYQVVFYEDKYEKEWDEFVLGKECVNGTFLQSRNFLKYHPKNRFKDSSIIIFNDKHTIIAVCPACTIEENGQKILFSHKGSTYGGLLIRRVYYTTDKVLGIINAFEQFAIDNGFEKVVLKLTPDLLSVQNTDLLQYMLSYSGYNEYTELSTYVDLLELKDDIISDLDRNKRRNIKKCIDNDLEFRVLNREQEIRAFHKLLTINLTKFNAKPIHTPEEILEFHNSRIPEIVKFYGVFYKGEQVAGGMLFAFESMKVLHAQNLSYNLEYTEFSPITFLYYSVIKQAKELGYSKLSWGISTEDQGRTINFGLIRNKESYNSKYSLNRTFYKELK